MQTGTDVSVADQPTNLQPRATIPRRVVERGAAGPGRAGDVAARAVVALVLAAAAALLAYTVWPGRMSNDTLAQIASVRTGQFSDWHAGLLIVLWRPFWLVGFGPGWVVAAGALAFGCGLYGLLRVAFGRPAALVGALAVAVTPQVLGYVGYVGRDLWYTAFFLCSCAAVGLLARGGWGRSARRGLIVGLLAALWLMMASRQNATPVAGVLLLGALCCARPEAGHSVPSGPIGRPSTVPDRRRGAARALRPFGARCAVAGLVLVGLFVSQSAAKWAFGVEASHPEQATFIYDLSVLSHRERQVLFSPAVFPAGDLATLEARYDLTNVNPLLFGPGAPIPFPVSDAAFAELRRDWWHAVSHHPVGYLVMRWRLYTAQVAWDHRAEWVYHPVVDPNPWGYHVAHQGWNDTLQRYLRHFAANDQLEGGPLHEVWVYLAATVAGLAHLRSARRQRQALGWACLASLAYQATIFVGAMGIGYRFALPTVVLGLVVGAVAARDVVVAGAAAVASRHRRSGLELVGRTMMGGHRG